MDTIIEVGAVAPVTFAIIVALRRAGLSDRWTPLVALGIGLVVGLVASAVAVIDLAAGPAAFGGILAGAAATGGHQAYKQLQTNPPR